jgi:ribA/ribD-fused uncharacterized protein
MLVDDIRTNEELLTFVAEGGKPEYHFFWHGPFSQWEPSSFFIDKEHYPTAEHYMMAEKARFFEDRDTLDKIMATTSPREAKRLGRKVSNFDAYAWNKACKELVIEGNVAKFEQNPYLKKHLVESKGVVLVEASPYDKVWGIGVDVETALFLDPSEWKGENYLGYVLMEVRTRL